MTDKEKLMGILGFMGNMMSFEEIVCTYLNYHDKDFSASRLKNLMDILNHKYLDEKIKALEETQFVANERATYIKTYLEGKMWKDEESAKANLQPQIENALAIIDACGRR